jgi:uncharacterized protein (TIGR03067 family)
MSVAGIIPTKVAFLMEAVMKSMVLTKLATASVAGLLLLSLCGLGIGGASVLTMRTMAQQPETPSRGTGPVRVAKTDMEKLQGEWNVVEGELDGEKIGPLQVPRVGFAGSDCLISGQGQFRFSLDTTAQPKRINFSLKTGDKEVKLTGIYLLEGDDLKLCWNRKEAAPTPTRFDFILKRGAGHNLLILKRKPLKAGNVEGTAEHDTAKSDLDRLQGVWRASWYERGGERHKADNIVFMVDKKRACWQDKDSETQGGLYLDPASKPKTFDLAASAGTIEGIYSLEGDTLQLCFETGTEPKRPGEFTAEKGTRRIHLGFKRIKGPEAFPFRLPDGTRAFPTIIEMTPTPPAPPRLIPQSKDNKPEEKPAK